MTRSDCGLTPSAAASPNHLRDGPGEDQLVASARIPTHHTLGRCFLDENLDHAKTHSALCEAHSAAGRGVC